MSPDSKDTESHKSTPSDNVIRNRKLNTQKSSNEQVDRTNDDEISNETSEKLIKNKSTTKFINVQNVENSDDNDLFSFQIKINLPVCLLFIIAFSMRFWSLDYPKSVV